MTTFFASGHHFGHANILKHENALRRNAHGGQLRSIEQMADYLIDQWNATVSSGGTAYHLCDLPFILRSKYGSRSSSCHVAQGFALTSLV